MKLFDDIQRVRSGYMRDSEPLFGYYNTSARAEVDCIRHLLEGWFSRYPVSGRKDLRSRFRSSGLSDHSGAFLELYVHELFLGLGFDMELHPDSPGGGDAKPDFRASRGNQHLYIEATIAGKDRSEVGSDQIAASVLDRVDAVESTEFFLDVHMRGAPTTQPRARALATEIATWLKQLPYEEVQANYRRSGFEDLPVLRWEHEEWVLEFRPIPKWDKKKGDRLIATRSGSFKAYDARTSIFNSLQKKIKKYGAFGSPFIICLNMLEPEADETDLEDALIGTPMIGVSRSGESKAFRRPDGVWVGKGGMKNKHSSGVLALFRLSPWIVDTAPPLLYSHPVADYDLKEFRFPFADMNAAQEMRDRSVDRWWSPKKVLGFPGCWGRM